MPRPSRKPKKPREDQPIDKSVTLNNDAHTDASLSGEEREFERQSTPESRCSRFSDRFSIVAMSAAAPDPPAMTFASTTFSYGELAGLFEDVKVLKQQAKEIKQLRSELDNMKCQWGDPELTAQLSRSSDVGRPVKDSSARKFRHSLQRGSNGHGRRNEQSSCQESHPLESEIGSGLSRPRLSALRRNEAESVYVSKSETILHEDVCSSIDFRAEENKHSKLTRSVWEIVLVVAHNPKGKRLKHPFEAIIALLLLALNSFLQIVVSIFLELEFTSGHSRLAEAQDWRINVGHWEKFASSSGVAMVSKMCQGDKSLELSGAQQAAILTTKSYLDDLAHVLPKGVVLCSWCLIIFFLRIWDELQITTDRMLSVWALPRSKNTVFYPVDDGSSFILHSIGRSRLIFCITLCFVRIGVACVICHAGTMWLLHTEDVVELLINAVTLAFILDIDDMLYRVACPLSMRALIEGIEPLYCPLIGGLHNPTRAIGTILACVAYMCGFGFTILNQNWKDIASLKDLYCGGDTNFIVGVNPQTGIVYSYAGAPTSVNINTSLMATIASELLRGQETNKSVKMTSWMSFQTSVKMELGESVATYGECRDSLPSDVFLISALKASLLHGHTSSCSDLSISECALMPPIIRLACPVTCACAEARAGFFDLGGCPLAKCSRNSSFQKSLTTMRTADIDLDVLSTMPQWSLYWKTYQDYISVHPSLGNMKWTPHFISEKFLSLGCEALRYFRGFSQGLADEVGIFFCQENAPLAYRPLRPFCPKSCNCGKATQADIFCPMPAPVSQIACSGVQVRGAQVLGNILCKQILANASSPEGQYQCIPSGHNGRNLYTYTDASGVIWEIKWETMDNLDWGALFLGSKIGLKGESKWTLTSVHLGDPKSHLRPNAARFFAQSQSQVPPVHNWLPRNSSTTDFDCAAGTMTAEGASRYWVGPPDTNQCTINYTMINSSARCQIAASGIGTKWEYVSSISDYPKGCYLWKAQGSIGVYFNPHPQGAPETFSHPICVSALWNRTAQS